MSSEAELSPTPAWVWDAEEARYRRVKPAFEELVVNYDWFIPSPTGEGGYIGAYLCVWENEWIPWAWFEHGEET